MKSALLARGYRLGKMLGFNPRITMSTVRNLGWFVRDLRAFKQRAERAETKIRFGAVVPALGDKTSESGSAYGHYFHQDLLVARRVFAASPRRHIDVGSRIDGFVAHVAAYREIEVLDIRPMTASIPNVVFRQADLMELPAGLVESTDSASCLHALEHFGLGRYGDEIDPDGHLKGLAALHALVRPGGTLYLSAPIGPQRIEFNAHRVFDVSYMLELFDQRFTVKRFSFVDDPGALHEDVPLAPADVAANFGCDYGCGIFELTRL